jgi:opacity protein-like surface antigen
MSVACRRLAVLAVTGASIFTGSTALAAPPWVERDITLPRHDWAFDFGLGLAHARDPDETAFGLNLEGAVGVTQDVELGFRSGVRFDDDARALRADEYGRLFDRQTFDTGGEVMANPEFRVRGALARGGAAEVALEGRAYLPIATGTRGGVMAGLPLQFHAGTSVRLDLGVYVPIIFYSDPYYAFSIPFDVWIQVTNKLWLGPMTGVRFNHISGDGSSTDFSLGFGLGYQIARALDFKTMLLFPHVNDNNAGGFGVGAGLQVRIE